MFPSRLWQTSALGVVLGMVPLAHALAADLTAYTEEWPPYNYTEGQHVKGISTDILRAACNAAKLHCEFKMVPWARAYKVVTETPNTVLYTTARKPSREAEFLWVGPILPRTTWVYGKSAHKDQFTDFTALATGRVGVVRDEASVGDLVAAGVPATALVAQSSNAEVLRMLMADMVDAMVDTEVGMDWALHHATLPPKSVTKFMKLTTDGAYYFALNRDSDPARAQALQNAIDTMRRTGKISAIVHQY